MLGHKIPGMFPDTWFENFSFKVFVALCSVSTFDKRPFCLEILSYVILSELEVNLSDIPQNDKQVSVISTSSNDQIMPKKGGFKIASLNIASLPKHIDELRIVMSNDEIDVLAVNESRMGSTVPNDMISIYGYS